MVWRYVQWRVDRVGGQDWVSPETGARCLSKIGTLEFDLIPGPILL